MQDHEIRLEQKVDKVVEDINDIKTTMAINTTQLTLHMKRSDALETIIEAQKEELTTQTRRIDKVFYFSSALFILISIFSALAESGLLGHMLHIK